MRLKFKGTALRKPETFSADHLLAYGIAKEMVNKYPDLVREFVSTPESNVTVMEKILKSEEKSEEVSVVKPTRKKLTKEEKLSLHKKLAGSARLFSKEGVEESLRIANREDWED